MHEMRARYGVPGKAERPSASQVREMRVGGHGEGLFDVRGQVRNVIVLEFKLPYRNLPALMT